jgi:hypothetical protein
MRFFRVILALGAIYCASLSAFGQPETATLDPSKQSQTDNKQSLADANRILNDTMNEVVAIKQTLDGLTTAIDQAEDTIQSIRQSESQTPKSETMTSQGSIRWFLLSLPLLPFITRGALWFIYARCVLCELPEDARDEETHRSASLGIAGFSVTIFAGLTVLEGTIGQNLELAIYFSATSFISYFLAFFVQGYKHLLLVDQIGDAAMETGSLVLFAALIALLATRSSENGVGIILGVCAILVWLIDHSLRWYFSYS